MWKYGFALQLKKCVCFHYTTLSDVNSMDIKINDTSGNKEKELNEIPVIA